MSRKSTPQAPSASPAQSAERYRELVEHSGEMITTHRPGDWAYTSVNPAVTVVAGYQPEEVLGKPAYDFFHPIDAEAMKRKTIPAIRRYGVRTFRYRHRHKNGNYHWVESTHRSIRDPDTGELREIIAVTRDISPQMEAERQARQHQADMAHAARLMAVGEMATALAHEINQPLATMLNYARGALRQIDAGQIDAAESLRPALDSIARQAQRAAEIVKRMRALVKKTPYRRQPVDLNALCAEVVEFLQHSLDEAQIVVILKPARAAPTVNGDRIQLEQVLINLLHNAMDAYRNSEAAPRRIELRTRVSADAAYIVVSDRAGGLDAAVRAHLFEPYVSSKPEGMGMGLSISRSIVEAHGGQIAVASDGRRYTRFTVQLPLES